MNKHTKIRKRLSLTLALCLVLSLVIGSFAFFTDRLEASSTATAGNIDLVWTDTSLASGSNNTFAQDKVWDNGGLVTTGNIINPGDHFDLSYTLSNTGNKSIDVRQQIVLESSVALTASAEEYALTITGGNDSTAVVPDSEATATGGTKLIYNLTDIILDGTGTGAETETGAVSGAYTVRLDFALAAKNAFMNSKVDVALYAAAKQHRNTADTDFPEFTALATVMQDNNWETIN